MGRSVTPAYVVEYQATGIRMSPACWRVSSPNQIPADGRPTVKNLARHVESFNRSFQKGGSNEHLAGTRIVAAMLLRNDGSREVVASWTAPTFHVLG